MPQIGATHQSTPVVTGIAVSGAAKPTTDLGSVAKSNGVAQLVDGLANAKGQVIMLRGRLRDTSITMTERRRIRNEKKRAEERVRQIKEMIRLNTQSEAAALTQNRNASESIIHSTNRDREALANSTDQTATTTCSCKQTKTTINHSSHFIHITAKSSWTDEPINGGSA